jgi:hypothetical protein
MSTPAWSGGLRLSRAPRPAALLLTKRRHIDLLRLRHACVRAV